MKFNFNPASGNPGKAQPTATLPATTSATSAPDEKTPQPAQPNPFAAAATTTHPAHHSKPGANPTKPGKSVNPTDREQEAISLLADSADSADPSSPPAPTPDPEAILENYTATHPLPADPTPADLLTHNLGLLETAYTHQALGRQTLKEIHSILKSDPELKDLLTPHSFASITKAMESLTAGARRKEAKTTAKAPARRAKRTAKSEAIDSIASLGISL